MMDIFQPLPTTSIIIEPLWIKVPFSAPSPSPKPYVGKHPSPFHITHSGLTAYVPITKIWAEATLAIPFIRKKKNRSEEHTSELQSLMRISYAVFCLQTKTLHQPKTTE